MERRAIKGAYLVEEVEHQLEISLPAQPAGQIACPTRQSSYLSTKSSAPSCPTSTRVPTNIKSQTTCDVGREHRRHKDKVKELKA